MRTLITDAAASIIKWKDGAAGDLKGHAHTLGKLAKAAQHFFPASSGQSAGKTTAKDEVWEDAAAFAKAAGGTCHKPYRKTKK